MADRVLTEREVDELAAWGDLAPGQARQLVESHRLLQRRVQKLEGLLEHVTGDVPR